VREVVADAAADGVVWVQPHFDPHIYDQFGTPERVMELVLAEGLSAGARHGVGFGVTIAAMRHRGPESAEDLARFAAAAVEDRALLADLAERNVTLDVCLTSNKALGVCPDMSRHPLPALLSAGVGCSLGADDPLMFGVGLLDEYQTARGELGLSDVQLAALARTSIRTSGAPAATVTAAMADIDAWLC
jgi:adenosine deaminase